MCNRNLIFFLAPGGVSQNKIDANKPKEQERAVNAKINKEKEGQYIVKAKPLGGFVVRGTGAGTLTTNLRL